jgi:hypothetical protein
MAVRVTRYGGPMAGMKPKTKIFEIAGLDPSTKQALETLLTNPQRSSVVDRAPDGFVYSFEMDEAEGSKREIEVGGTHVPEALRKLLP